MPPETAAEREKKWKLEIESRDEQIREYRNSLELAQHVQRLTDQELQEQRRIAENAAVAHRTTSSEVSLHKEQVDDNLEELKAMRHQVEQLIAAQEEAESEHMALVAAAEQRAEARQQELETQCRAHEQAVNDMERRHRLAERSAELVQEHLSRQLADGGLTEPFVARHTDEVRKLHARCDQLEAENRKVLEERDIAVREAREQAEARADEGIEALRLEMDTLKAAHANELEDVERAHRAHLEQVHELKAQLVQQLAVASEVDETEVRDPDPQLEAEVEALRQDLAKEKEENAANQITIALGERQSKAFVAVMDKARKEAVDDRRRSLQQSQELRSAREQLSAKEKELAAAQSAASELQEQVELANEQLQASAAQNEDLTAGRDECQRLLDAARKDSSDRERELSELKRSARLAADSAAAAEPELAVLPPAAPAAEEPLTSPVMSLKFEKGEPLSPSSSSDEDEQPEETARQEAAAKREAASEARRAAASKREAERAKREEEREEAAAKRETERRARATEREAAAAKRQAEREAREAAAAAAAQGKEEDEEEPSEEAASLSSEQEDEEDEEVDDEDDDSSEEEEVEWSEEEDSDGADQADELAAADGTASAEAVALEDRQYEVRILHSQDTKTPRVVTKLQQAPIMMLEVAAIGLTLTEDGAVVANHAYADMARFRTTKGTVCVEFNAFNRPDWRIEPVPADDGKDKSTLSDEIVEQMRRHADMAAAARAASKRAAAESAVRAFLVKIAQGGLTAPVVAALEAEGVSTVDWEKRLQSMQERSTLDSFLADAKDSSVAPEDAVSAELVEKLYGCVVGDFVSEQILGVYKVLVKAKLKATPQLSSKELGILYVGKRVEVVECVEIPSESGPVLRLRCDKGWFSLQSQQGETIAARQKPLASKAAVVVPLAERLGEYRVLNIVVLRKNSATDSEKVGTLDKGEVVEAKECMEAADGTLRLRCASGWFSLKPHLVEKLAEEDIAPVPRVARRGNNTRRASVAVDGIGQVASELEKAAQLHGLTGETVFDVRQSHLPKVNPQVQMKVGGMGVQLFDGPTFLESYNYVSISKWHADRKEFKLVMKDKKRKIKFRTGDAKDIAQTMQEHTLRLQAQRKADRAQKQQSLRDGAPDFAPTPLGDIGEDSSTDDENVGEYRVLNFCQVRVGESLSSEQAGMLEAGEIIKVTESKTLDDGRTRLRCQEGWISLKAALVQKLDSDEAVPIMRTPTRRGSTEIDSSFSLQAPQPQKEVEATPPVADPLSALGSSVVVKVVRCAGLIGADKGGTRSDPYVALQLGEMTKKTERREKTLDPVFNEEFEFEVASWSSPCALRLSVSDYDVMSKDDFLGEASVDLAAMAAQVLESNTRALSQTLSLGDPEDKLAKSEKQQVEKRAAKGQDDPYGKIELVLDFGEREGLMSEGVPPDTAARTAAADAKPQSSSSSDDSEEEPDMTGDLENGTDAHSDGSGGEEESGDGSESEPEDPGMASGSDIEPEESGLADDGAQTADVQQAAAAAAAKLKQEEEAAAAAKLKEEEAAAKAKREEEEAVALAKKGQEAAEKQEPQAPPKSLVKPKTFAAKHAKKKVKLTVSIDGLKVEEDSKKSKKLSEEHGLDTIYSVKVAGRKKDSLEVAMRKTPDAKVAKLLFELKEAEQLQNALQAAREAIDAWSEEQSRQRTEAAKTPEPEPEPEPEPKQQTKPEPEPEPEPEIRYKALAAGMIRTGAALDSPKAKPEKLKVGQVIVVTEQREVGGQLRLRFDGGWTSQTAKSGKVLLELLEPEPGPETDGDESAGSDNALEALAAELGGDDDDDMEDMAQELLSPGGDEAEGDDNDVDLEAMMGELEDGDEADTEQADLDAMAAELGAGAALPMLLCPEPLEH